MIHVPLIRIPWRRPVPVAAGQPGSCNLSRTGLAWLVMLALLVLSLPSNRTGARAEGTADQAGEAPMQQAGSDKPGADDAPPSDLEAVIAELTAEARQAIEQDVAYPRDRADYAREKDLQLSHRTLLTALSAPQHRHPAIDAYIRWQLTGFGLDAAQMTEADWQRLIERMPAFVPGGELDDRSRRIMEKDWSRGPRTDAPAHVMRQLEQVRQHWQARKERVRAINEPTRAYRQWLRQALPEQPVMELHWRLVDLEQRIRDKRPAHPRRKLLVSKTVKLARDPALSIDDRRRLARRAQQVHELTNQRVARLQVERNGKTRIRSENLHFAGKDYEVFRDALRGRMPKQPPRRRR